MRKIKEVVVVEGKTDTATLKQLFDVDTIETSGSGINEDILSLIKTAAKTRGVIDGKAVHSKFFCPCCYFFNFSRAVKKAVFRMYM